MLMEKYPYTFTVLSFKQHIEKSYLQIFNLRKALGKIYAVTSIIPPAAQRIQNLNILHDGFTQTYTLSLYFSRFPTTLCPYPSFYRVPGGGIMPTMLAIFVHVIPLFVIPTEYIL